MIRPLSGFCRLILAALVLGCLLGSPLQAREKSKVPKIKDIADTVLSNRILTKFAILLRASDLASFLSSRGPLTFFAPVNSAFSRMSPETFAALQLPENKEVLQRIVLFHAVNGKRLTQNDLKPLKTVLSCEGNPLPLRVNHTGYQIVSKAKILRADTKCENGLLHEIDTVLLPPGVSLTTLASARAVAPSPSSTNGDSSTNSAPASNETPAGNSPVTNEAPATSEAPSSKAPATNAASILGPLSPEPTSTNADVPTNVPPLVPAR